jgi:hypothetical protein
VDCWRGAEEQKQRKIRSDIIQHKRCELRKKKEKGGRSVMREIRKKECDVNM